MVGNVEVDKCAVFPRGVNLYGTDFSFSSISSHFDKGMYLTDDGTLENIHTCAYVTKV